MSSEHPFYLPLCYFVESLLVIQKVLPVPKNSIAFRLFSHATLSFCSQTFVLRESSWWNSHSFLHVPFITCSYMFGLHATKYSCSRDASKMFHFLSEWLPLVYSLRTHFDFHITCFSVQTPIGTSVIQLQTNAMKLEVRSLRECLQVFTNVGKWKIQVGERVIPKGKWIQNRATINMCTWYTSHFEIWQKSVHSTPI